MARSTHQDFTAFVRSQQPRKGEDAVDWDLRRDEWLAYLDSLYADIQKFLKDFIEDGTISVSFLDVPLTEENIGAYVARSMQIKIGLRTVTLTPIGTLLIGTKGRVDIIGTAGRSRLILADKDTTSARQMVTVTVGHGSFPADPPPRKPVNWVWKIVSAPPQIHFSELNEDTFLQVLMEVSGNG